MVSFSNIKVNVITGFLGTGKTSCILHLLKHKPENERWAVLVNEFGQLGMDANLIESELSSAVSKPNEISIKEIPGGCMCCSSGIPMSVALNQLIKQANPDRILMEPTGLGHPRAILAELRSNNYKDVLVVENTLTLANGKHFLDERYLTHDIFQQQLNVADVIVLNKMDQTTEGEIEAFKEYLQSKSLQNKPIVKVEQGAVSIDVLYKEPLEEPPKVAGFSFSNFTVFKPQDPEDAVVQEQQACNGFERFVHKQDGYVSYGWRYDEGKIFNLSLLKKVLANCLDSEDHGFYRIKGVGPLEDHHQQFSLNLVCNDDNYDEISTDDLIENSINLSKSKPLNNVGQQSQIEVIAVREEILLALEQELIACLK